MFHREKYYTGVVGDSNLKIKLTGSWETIVGAQDTFGELVDILLIYIGHWKTSVLC